MKTYQESWRYKMHSSYNKLRGILEEFLKDEQLIIEPSPMDTYPLFLLFASKLDVVGFATLNGQPEENFSKAFEKFKNLYSLRSTEWANFDLTLVLCKTDGEKVTDEFCNKIEMDPYFCRKFVIDLTAGDLKAELARLPFIPLQPESIVGFKRPISAQTFLMKHDVISDLARHLVVPHDKGIKKIVKECFEGLLGEPAWPRTEAGKFLLPQYEAKPEVRLKELEINNFRAYRGSHKFDLDADLIVLFGPNGFGKTSFFDAIDFVCTGGVARFDARFGRKTDRLLKALKHLDSSVDDSLVKTTVLIDSKEEILERYMKNRTQTYIGGVPKNRTKALMVLAGLLEKSTDIRIENLVRLFRATHLFGQEYQSLTSGFRDHSRLSEDTVSRMLAFQDYVEAINKTKRISEELQRQIKEKESGITFLRNSLKSKEVEVKQLSQSAKIVKKPEAVLTIGKDIAEKIIRKIKIQIEIPKEFNQEIVQDWRTKIAVQKNFISQNLVVIEKLEANFPELVNRRKKLKERTLGLTQNKQLLGKLNKDYSKKKKKLGEFDERLKRMFLEERNLSLKRENFNWLLQAKVEYQQFKEQIAKENKNYRDVQVELLGLSPKIEKLKSEKKELEGIIGEIKSEIKIIENSLRELSDFEKGVGGWLKAANSHKELKVYLGKIEQEVDNVKNTLRIKKDKLNAAALNRDKLRKHIDNLQQNQSELRTLLDNIERHILNNICPVCGTQHRSQTELIEKLKFQRGIQPNEIQEALNLFEDAKASTNEIEKHVSDLKIRIKQLEQKAMESQKELLAVKMKIKTYEEKANSLDIPITLENLMNVFSSKKKKVLEKMNIKQQELFKQKSRIKKQQEELTTFVNQQGSLERNLRTIKSRQNQLLSMIDQISNDASTRQVSLDIEKEMIQRELITTNSNFKDLREQIEINQTEKQNLHKELGSLMGKKNILEREIQEIDKEILDSKKYVEEMEHLINRLKLNLDIDMDQILSFKKDFTRKISSLDSLQNEIINFEIALDAVETSAALAKIQQDIKNIKKTLQSLEKERDRSNKWLLYFDVIRKELELLQTRALREYTEKYGPLTSTVQRRLRSVYGFGNIGLNPEKGGIAVRVERKGEKNISPSDYFSESQIQIVMLSLFLSATLTQTWSSFSPILLDDPVEHFDDLNAYSLLDLIRGLIMEPSKKRQFIISTCEDRLFRLMRQKFNKMDDRAIFYVFESIGENGPVINRL